MLFSLSRICCVLLYAFCAVSLCVQTKAPGSSVHAYNLCASLLHVRSARWSICNGQTKSSHARAKARIAVTWLGLKKPTFQHAGWQQAGYNQFALRGHFVTSWPAPLLTTTVPDALSTSCLAYFHARFSAFARCCWTTSLVLGLWDAEWLSCPFCTQMPTQRLECSSFLGSRF